MACVLEICFDMCLRLSIEQKHLQNKEIQQKPLRISAKFDRQSPQIWLFSDELRLEALSPIS